MELQPWHQEELQSWEWEELLPWGWAQVRDSGLAFRPSVDSVVGMTLQLVMVVVREDGWG